MLQIGFFSRRMIEQMGLDSAGGQLQDLIEQLREAGMSEEELAQLGELMSALQDALRRAVRQYVERELDKQNHDYMERFRRESLQEKSFYNLTEEDLRNMRDVVNRLAQKLKNIVSMRRKRERKGKFDLKTTMRKNMGHGGIPFELIFKHRKKERPKLIILCDISSSVANVSRFFLQFAYSLQEVFTKIRSFVFVAELGEVTQLFRDYDVYDAIDKSVDGGDVINPYTRSNFGMAFHVFWRDFLSSLDLRTTVVVIGDARNNYNDPRSWCLAGGAQQGQERDLDQSGSPRGLGLRRQRDGQVFAVHGRRGRVPESEAAEPARGQAGPLVLDPLRRRAGTRPRWTPLLACSGGLLASVTATTVLRGTCSRPPTPSRRELCH